MFVASLYYLFILFVTLTHVRHELFMFPVQTVLNIICINKVLAFRNTGSTKSCSSFSFEAKINQLDLESYMNNPLKSTSWRAVVIIKSKENASAGVRALHVALESTLHWFPQRPVQTSTDQCRQRGKQVLLQTGNDTILLNAPEHIMNKNFFFFYGQTKYNNSMMNYRLFEVSL